MVQFTQLEHYSRPQYVEFCMQSASLALIYYDYFLTLGREVKYVWARRPFNLMSLAFLFCRYSLIANMTFMFGLVHKLHHTRCDEFYVVSAVFSTIGRVGIMAILGSRACAVWRYNKWVKILLGVMGVLVVCVSVLHIPHVSCSAKPGQNRAPSEILTIMTVIYEVTTTVLLISGCVRNFESLNELRNDGLVVLMIKEGLAYTVLVTGLTSTGIWIYYAAPVGSFCQRLLNGFCIPLSGIMCARFFLHVRLWQERAPRLRALKALPHYWSPPHSYDDLQPAPGSTSSSIQSYIQTHDSSYSGHGSDASSDSHFGRHRGRNIQHGSNGHHGGSLERAGSSRSGESSSSRAVSTNMSVLTSSEPVYEGASSSLLTVPSPMVPRARGERHESTEQCHRCPAHLPEGWVSETPPVCEGPKNRHRGSASITGRSSLIDVDRMLGDSPRPRGSEVQDGYLSSDTESWSRSRRASRRKRRRQQKKRETPDVSDMV